MSNLRTVAASAAAIVLFVSSSVAAKTDSGEWREVTSEAGFRVSLPGDVKRTSETVMTGMGLITQTYLAASRDGATFRAGCSEFAGDIPAPAGLMLDVTRDQWIAGVGGRLVREARIDVGGAPGREWTVRVPGGRMLCARVIATNRRIFTLTIETSTERLRSEEFRAVCRAFYSSFALSAP